MFDGPVSVNIGNVCDGAVPERFEHEMKRILANIADPNTDPEAKRCLTLEFKISPSPDRKSAVVSFACKSKVPGATAVAGSIFFSKGLAYTEDPRQAALFAKESPATPQPQ
jgi:hypothetical protein